MRILIAHNHYRQHGGEDAVVRTEYDLLKDFGHNVRLYERSNAEIDFYSYKEKLRFVFGNGWSDASYREMREIIRESRPDVVHFHNIFFVMTPSVYQACKDEGVAVVQSQHNFRLLCANAIFFREQGVCEECADKKTLWRGVYHGCYKHSRLLTACIAKMIAHHWKKGTWHTLVDAYILATEFGRQKYIAAGIPKDRITVKPNIAYPSPRAENQDKGYALYVGRLSEEKGVRILLEAFRGISDLPLKIVGDGPIANQLRRYAVGMNIKNVEFLGFVSHDRYDGCMRSAKFLVVPSICYENFPRIMAEAYGYGIPMVASSLGGIPEIIKDKQTGLLFTAGDSHDLTDKIKWFMAHDKEVAMMREQIHKRYAHEYSAQKNYDILTDIYSRAITNHNSTGISTTN